jgi:hypothetical protein
MRILKKEFVQWTFACIIERQIKINIFILCSKLYSHFGYGSNNEFQIINTNVSTNAVTEIRNWDAMVWRLGGIQNWTSCQKYGNHGRRGIVAGSTSNVAGSKVQERNCGHKVCQIHRRKYRMNEKCAHWSKRYSTNGLICLSDEVLMASSGGWTWPWFWRKRFRYVGFEVHTAVVMKSIIFWHITLYSQLKVNRLFGGTHVFCLQGRMNRAMYQLAT